MRPDGVPNRPTGESKASRARRRLGTLTLLAGLLVPAAAPAHAASIAVARDAETEALIQDYARPLFKVAGVRADSIQIFLIQNQSFNAFVADPTRMFINTGTLIESETPGEVIGVLAHETAHIANGDLAGLRNAVQSARSAALLGAVVGIGTAIAGSLAGGGGEFGGAGFGIAAGSAQFGQRSLLAYQRTQEAAADRAAIKYLDATGQSAAGMLKTMQRMANQVLFAVQGADPYTQSHPLPAERVANLESLVGKSRYRDRPDPPDLQRRHDLVRAKLIAFTMTPQQVGRRYAATDTSLPARYARAIAAYRSGALAPAVKQIDGLIASEPGNPYFWELKGQALLEGGRPAEAIAPLRKAVSLAPRSGLLRILLGQALVASGDRANMDEAIKNLTVGLQSDPDVPYGYRFLARAYALRNDVAMAELATAQGLFADGNIKEAQAHAARAQAKLKPGSPGWLRADDIVSYKPPKKR